MGKKSTKVRHSKKSRPVLGEPGLIWILMLSLLVPITYTLVFSEIELLGERDLYDLSGECSLSLCDCECYPTQEMPEVTEGKICGNDCYSMFDIEGCELTEEGCSIILRDTHASEDN